MLGEVVELRVDHCLGGGVDVSFKLSSCRISDDAVRCFACDHSVHRLIHSTSRTVEGRGRGGVAVFVAARPVPSRGVVSINADELSPLGASPTLICRAMRRVNDHVGAAVEHAVVLQV